MTVRLVVAAALMLLALPATAVARIDVPKPPRAQIVWAYPDEIAAVCDPDHHAYFACTDVDNAVVYAALGVGRFAVAHEMGHLENAEVWAKRPWVYSVIMRRLGLKPGPWTTDENITDPTTGLTVLRERVGYECTPQLCPSEVAADAYASCRLHMMPVRHDRQGRIVSGWETSYGWTPRTNRVERRICRTFVNAAG
jgi:hypothetical protein